MTSRDYPGRLSIRDVRELSGRDFSRAAVIVASPPCEQFSRHDQPWTKRRNPPPPDPSIWRACERIAAEAGAPLLIENVRGAQKFMGRAAWHVGPFYLWGAVPALMPRLYARKGFWWWSRDAAGKWAVRTKESRTAAARLERAKVPFELATYVASVFLPFSAPEPIPAQTFNPNHTREEITCTHMQ